MLANIFLAATVVGAASAHLPAVAKRDFFLQGRQDVDETCQSALNEVMPLYADLPIPSDDLMSATLPSDPCETPSFTGSLSSEYSSYTSEVLDWYSSNSAALNSALSSCSSLASYASDMPVCSSPAETGATTSAAASSGATATSGPTATSGAAQTSGSTASSSASQTPTQNAAPRETGFVMVAAAAAAGLMGAVAVL